MVTMSTSIAMPNEEDNCLKQLEVIKEDFVKTVSQSDTSSSAATDNEGIL